MPQGEGEGHVLVNGHVGEQGVVLEDHGDVPLRGVDIVHELAVDVELPVGDFLQPRDHAQRRGLAAAGGPDQHDEFLIRNVDVEGLYRYHALLRDLEIGASRSFAAGVALPAPLHHGGVGIDLFYIM